MKKQSRLAVLLAAILVCVITCTGVAFATATELNSSLSDVEAALSAEEVQAQLVYSQLMETATLKDFFDTLMMEENNTGAYALNEEQLNELYQHIQAMYAAIENPTDEDTEYYDMLVETLQVIAEGNGVELLANKITDDYTFTTDYTINTAISIKNEGEGEANWTFANGTLTINATVTIPSGQALDIIVGSADNDKIGRIVAGAELGDSPMFVVESGGHLKIGYSYSQNYGEIGITGGKIVVQDGGHLSVGEIEDISGTAVWEIGARNPALNVYGDIPVKGSLTINGTSRDSSIIKASSSGKAVEEIKTGRELTANGKHLFDVAKGCSLSLNNVTVDGGAVWGSGNEYGLGRLTTSSGLGNVKIVRVVTPDSKDDKLEFSANNCVFQNVHSAGYVMSFPDRVDAKISDSIMRNCQTDSTAGVVYISSNSDVTENTPRSFTASNVQFISCASVEAGSAGGILRTNGTTYINMTVSDCTFKNNYSGGWGNILWNAVGSCTIENSTFKENYARRRGGAISSEGENMQITNCTFINNHAGEHGGAICMFPYTLTGKDDASISKLVMDIDIGSGCTFEGNYAEYGGAVAIILQESKSTKPTVVNSDIVLGSGYMKNNTATNGGGAVYAGAVEGANSGSQVILSINSGSIYSNSAPMGGAIYVDDLRTTIDAVNEVHVNGGAVGGSGTPNTATSSYGGAVYISNGNFKMSNGMVSYNRAQTAGGAIYVAGGNFEISGGTIANNTTIDGGAAYVTGGTFTMNGGVMSTNTASANGGAAYVSGGTFTMNNGTMSSNTAPNGNGGAVYVSNGNFDMYGGTLGGSGAGNSALNGGAVYVIGGDFNMISGVMSYNVAVEKTSGAAEGGTEGYGGAVYAAKSGNSGGNVVIGVENCTGAGTAHSVTHTDLAHPKVNDNEAEFGGGFAVNGGSVAFYCGEVQNNKTDSDGTGKNVFMKDGEIVHYLDGTLIGTNTNHGMVSTGGTLTVYFKEEGTEKYFTVELIYNSNYNDATKFDVVWKGEAPSGYYLNLPYCPTEWQEYQGTKELSFVGWTETELDVNSSTIRSAADYMPVGYPTEIKDMTTGDDANIMRFYAVWAPETSNIHYACVTDGVNIDYDWDYKGPSSYNYTINATSIEIGKPTMSGYTFQKWILYAEYGTDFTQPNAEEKTINISNWNSDAEGANATAGKYIPTQYSEIDAGTLISSVSETLTEDTLNTLQNFGDITLVAVFEPAFSQLKIVKEGAADNNQTFIFHIQGKPADTAKEAIDMKVVVKGNSSVTIVEIPVGSYTVTELEDWSWRYDVKSIATTQEQIATLSTRSTPAKNVQSITISDPQTQEVVTFTNDQTVYQWLDGEAYNKNEFSSN